MKRNKELPPCLFQLCNFVENTHSSQIRSFWDLFFLPLLFVVRCWNGSRSFTRRTQESFSNPVDSPSAVHSVTDVWDLLCKFASRRICRNFTFLGEGSIVNHKNLWKNGQPKRVRRQCCQYSQRLIQAGRTAVYQNPSVLLVIGRKQVDKSYELDKTNWIREHIWAVIRFPFIFWYLHIDRFPKFREQSVKRPT